MSTPERPPQPARRGPPTWAWGASVALYLLLGVPNLLRNRDEAPGYAAGAFVGGLASALLVALLIRFIYVRVAAKDRQLWSPWVFVIAAAILLVAALGRAGEAIQESAAGGDDVESAEELFVELPTGLRYLPSPPRERQQLEASFSREVGDSDDIEVRRIRRNDGAQSLAIAVVQDRIGNLEDVEQGFEEAGGNGSIQMIEGTEFLIGRDPTGRYLGYTGSGNGLVLILAASEADLRSFARPFADG